MLAARMLAALALVGACSSKAAAPPTTDALDAATPDGIPLFTLYDLGMEPGSQTFGIHADADGVYWVQKDGWVYRGARDGSRPPERWAQLRGVYADTMASDPQRLYWIDRTRLHFKDKADGTEGDVPLAYDHSGGGLAVDARFVYLAMPGCPVVTRIDRTTLADEEKSIAQVVIDPRGGGASLLLDGSALYCGSWSHVFRVDDWAAPARKLADSGFRLWGMAAVGDNLFWVNNPGPSSSMYTYVSRLVVSTGQVSDHRQEIGRGASNLVTSPDGDWIFFTADTLMWAFSTREQRYVVAVPPDPGGRRLVFYGHNLASDGEAIYYLAFRDGNGGRLYGVHRLPFSWLMDRVSR